MTDKMNVPMDMNVPMVTKLKKKWLTKQRMLLKDIFFLVYFYIFTGNSHMFLPAWRLTDFYKKPELSMLLI